MMYINKTLFYIEGENEKKKKDLDKFKRDK